MGKRAGIVRLAIIVPCYNEAEGLENNCNTLTSILQGLISQKKVRADSFICLVDDGSKDDTWTVIEQLHHKSKLVRALKLAHNRGHQNALLAGLHYCEGQVDCTISIDADLQQDPGKIPDFLDAYYNGAEIIFGIRNARNTDSLFKRLSASFFYRFMKSLGADIIENHADYRLVSDKVLKALKEHRESNLFLRGMFVSFGYPTARVYFDVRNRTQGTSKYNLSKMLRLALDGITSFSIKPLRVVTTLGFIFFLISIGMACYILFYTLTVHGTVPGWASTVLPIYLIGSIQLLSLGIVGEYIGKIYQETKQRPQYLIEETLQ